MHDLMSEESTRRILDRFERGRITRRQLVAALMALGAARAGAGASGQTHPATRPAAPTFQASGLDHIALRVSDVGRSAAFYREHLGLAGGAEGGASAFLGPAGGAFVLALFRGDRPGLDHYCYRIDNYEAGAAVEKLQAAGLAARRQGNRVYFDDPDGIEVQVEG